MLFPNCYIITRNVLNITPDFFRLHRTKQNLDLNDELARSKRLLDEKYFEAGRLREEAVSKGDQNNDQRA